jgi:hypothetical protein
MESYQSNLEIINTDNNKYRFTDKKDTFDLQIISKDDKIEFILTIEGGIQTFKVTLTQSELFKFSLFKVVENLENVMEIIDVCLKNGGVNLKYQNGYVLTFYNLFFKTYLTATILLTPEENKIEYTVSRLGDMIISLHKDKKQKAEEINTLKALIADTKDQIKNLADILSEKSLTQENLISDLRKENVKISERLLALESKSDISKSKILKKEDYSLLKTWIGKEFKLELLYSSYDDGDQSYAFHSKCDGVGRTLTVVKTTTGYRFGGYTGSPWNSSNAFINGDGSEFLFSFDKKAIYKNNQSSYAIYGGSNYLATFGAGYDIFLANGCTSNQSSYSQPSSYTIPSNIAGAYNFQVSVIEVFEVI